MGRLCDLRPYISRDGGVSGLKTRQRHLLVFFMGFFCIIGTSSSLLSLSSFLTTAGSSAFCSFSTSLLARRGASLSDDKDMFFFNRSVIKG